MKRFALVIVGGGLASARAIKSYREAGGAGTIALLSRDSALPYHRPPLSKRFLRGETDEPPLVEDERFYRDNGVEVVLETPVAAVDADEGVVTAEGGARYGYDKLLIATGAWPRRLDVAGEDHDGVFALRTLADSEAIRATAAEAERAVVVGGGFIGMEVAASLRRLELEVTLVHRGSGLFDQLRCDQLSSELSSLYGDNGVELLLEEEVTAFESDPELRFVTTKSGRQLETDLAVVGVGVAPVVDFLESSRLALDNGVVVNERFETSAPGIFAVGDVASFFDPLFGRQRRIEHWSNANYQGDEVGKLLAGADGGYDTVSSFFSEVFGLTLKVFGDVSRFDELASNGSLRERDFVATYAERGRLVAALTVGQSDEVEGRLKELIAARAPMSAALAADRCELGARGR